MLSDGALAGLAREARRLLHSLDEPLLAPFLADWPGHAWPDLPGPRAVASGSPARASDSRFPDVESDLMLPVLRCLSDFAVAGLVCLARRAIESKGTPRPGCAELI